MTKRDYFYLITALVICMSADAVLTGGQYVRVAVSGIAQTGHAAADSIYSWVRINLIGF